MPEDATLLVRGQGAVCRVTLNRPSVHNAFDDLLVCQLTNAIGAASTVAGARVVVLDAVGPSFCAGADASWMRRMAEFDRARNLEDARALARLFHTIATCPLPVVARVHGVALGGGCGLIAAADIAMAADTATFGFSEVKLGLIPATIAPYVVEKIGATAARRYFLTGERFTAAEAHRIGLLAATCPEADLDAAIERTVGELLSAGPEAIARAKALVHEIALRKLPEVNEYTARLIAEVRASAEAQEGLAAFLEKRRPAWRE